MEAQVKLSRLSRRAFLLLGAASVLTLAAACSLDVPVDRKCNANESASRDCNPGVAAPAGLIRGTITYIGPGPCIKDGKIEGAAVALLFDAANPPPPDGLATTALNFASVPGERLFASVPRPKTGPGSPGNPNSYCPPLDTPPVTAATDFIITQLPAGKYQVRGFYSRQNKFMPIFDYSNLPLAGDVGGGLLVDPRAASPQFATITVGVPDPKGKLTIPPAGYIADGVPMILGQLLTASRPYFYLDYAGSRGFTNVKPPVAGEATVAYPADEPTANAITIPQDHPLSAEPNFTGTPPDIFKNAQASFPSLHFKYGFPGDPAKFDAPPVDAWLAKNAKPSDPFFPDKVRPFYGIDPLDGPTPQSKTFTITRAFTATGEPAILHDNVNIETFKFAQLFPLVVLAKLKDDPATGLPIDPPTPQTDPVVVLQGITLRNNSMTATSALDGTGLASEKSKPGEEDLQADFTSLIRTAALCVDPTQGLQGVLTAPYFRDINPALPRDDTAKTPVNPDLVLKYQTQVKSVTLGCLPPGWYSVNVVYPTGQAWSLPNQMGYCTYGPGGKLVETCKTISSVSPDQASKGFNSANPGRPLLVSQQIFRDEGGKKVPQIVQITPSPRCMKVDASGTKWTNNATHEDKNGNGARDGDEPDADSDGFISLRIPDACLPKATKGAFVYQAPK